MLGNQHSRNWLPSLHRQQELEQRVHGDLERRLSFFLGASRKRAYGWQVVEFSREDRYTSPMFHNAIVPHVDCVRIKGYYKATRTSVPIHSGRKHRWCGQPSLLGFPDMAFRVMFCGALVGSGAAPGGWGQGVLGILHRVNACSHPETLHTQTSIAKCGQRVHRGPIVSTMGVLM